MNNKMLFNLSRIKCRTTNWKQ